MFYEDPGLDSAEMQGGWPGAERDKSVAPKVNQDTEGAGAF